MSYLYRIYYAPYALVAISLLPACIGLNMLTRRRYGRKGFRLAMLCAALCYGLLLVSFSVLTRESGVQQPVRYQLGLQLAAYIKGLNHDGLRGLIMNLFMFVPLGAILAALLYRGQKNWPAVLFAVFGCFALSIGIEFSQYYFSRGLAEAEDVLMNTLGGICGAGVVLFSKESH